MDDLINRCLHTQPAQARLCSCGHTGKSARGGQAVRCAVRGALLAACATDPPAAQAAAPETTSCSQQCMTHCACSLPVLQRPSARELVQLLEAIPGGQAGTRRAAQMSPQLSPVQSWQRSQAPQLQPSGSSELPSLASSDAKRRSSSPLPSGFLPPLGSTPSSSLPPHALEVDMRSPFDQV